jgi:hypothetical protein
MTTIVTTSCLLARLNSAQEWFAKYGIDAKSGRVAEYENLLQQAEKTRQAESPAKWPHDRMRALFAAGCEIFDLIEISQLKDDVLKGHRSKLAAVVKGSTFYDEVGTAENDQGRDATFELLTASGMQRAGATPRLEKPADVCADFGDLLALIECKRPKTVNGYVRLMLDASRQFSVHRKNGHDAAGVVAVDLTRLINPNLHILPAASRDEAIEALHRHTEAKVNELATELAKQREQFHEGALIDATIVRTTAMSINEADGRPEVVTAIQIRPQSLDRNSREFRYAIQLKAKYDQVGVNRFD